MQEEFHLTCNNVIYFHNGISFRSNRIIAMERTIGRNRYVLPHVFLDGVKCFPDIFVFVFQSSSGSLKPKKVSKSIQILHQRWFPKFTIKFFYVFQLHGEFENSQSAAVFKVGIHFTLPSLVNVRRFSVAFVFVKSLNCIPACLTSYHFLSVAHRERKKETKVKFSAV